MHCSRSPGKAKEDVTLLRRPTARGSSSTERMCRALGLCIHMVPVQSKGIHMGCVTPICLSTLMTLLPQGMNAL